MKKKERLLYKIWNKKNECYESGNGKTHWRSMKWIAAKLRDLKKWNWEMKDFEVHTFELQLIETQPASDIFDEDEKIQKNKRMNKEIAERMKTKIGQVFPGVAVYQIRQMYNTGALDSRYMMELKPLIDNLVQAERTL